MSPGKSSRREVLDPDSRMEELGLMAGHHEGGGRRTARPSVDLGGFQAPAAQVVHCGGDDLLMNLDAKATSSAALEIVIPGGKVFRGLGELLDNLTQGRNRQQGAVGCGSPQAVALHPRHPPATSSPARLRESWRT